MAVDIQYCGYCGTELTDGISVCPNCGRDNSVPMLGVRKSDYSGRRKDGGGKKKRPAEEAEEEWADLDDSFEKEKPVLINVDASFMDILEDTGFTRLFDVHKQFALNS